MKVVVSYINSRLSVKETIKLINESKADGVHVDLMDGVNVPNKNFDIDILPELFVDNTKPLDVHMMVNEPHIYLDKILSLNPDCIYIDPKTDVGIVGLLDKMAMFGIKKGIVINPDVSVDSFEDLYLHVNRVLLMSVVPGAGGQRFMKQTRERLLKLLEYQKKYHFEIFVDGGINDETVLEVREADGVVSGSYICHKVNYDEAIASLK